MGLGCQPFQAGHHPPNCAIREFSGFTQPGALERLTRVTDHAFWVREWTRVHASTSSTWIWSRVNSTRAYMKIRIKFHTFSPKPTRIFKRVIQQSELIRLFCECLQKYICWWVEPGWRPTQVCVNRPLVAWKLERGRSQRGGVNTPPHPINLESTKLVYSRQK